MAGNAGSQAKTTMSCQQKWGTPGSFFAATTSTKSALDQLQAVTNTKATTQQDKIITGGPSCKEVLITIGCLSLMKFRFFIVSKKTAMKL